MGNITPIKSSATVAESQPIPGDMPSLEELLAQNRKLQEEKAAAEEKAAGYLDQYEKLKSRPRGEMEMTTTTTKPVWPFEVDGPNGIEKFDVVDESEAKRLYCIKHAVESSACILKVRCLNIPGRNNAIRTQYVEAAKRNEELHKALQCLLLSLTHQWLTQLLRVLLADNKQHSLHQ